MILPVSWIMSQPCASPANVFTFFHGGHTYEVVKEKYTWETAALCAVERGGYLVHINDLPEQTAVFDAIINGAAVPVNYVIVPDGGGVAYVWIGATDSYVEGEWNWDGDNNGSGISFWMGQGAAGTGGGYPVGGSYINWGGTSTGIQKEPDNWSGTQDGAAIGLAPWPSGIGSLGIAGEWNDINMNNQLYFVVEKENTGMSEKPIQNLQIFPNPVNELLHIRSFYGRITSIEISNFLGQILITQKPSPSTQQTIRFESNNPGIYLVHVTLESGDSIRAKVLITK